MKRILIITVLAVLLMSTVGATTALAAKQKTEVTGKLYGSNTDGSVATPVVGTVTFNTTDGTWKVTLSNKATLPPADYGQYALGITTARPVHGMNPGSSYTLTDINAIILQPDGTISQTGVSDAGAAATVKECLATGGVFILMAYTSS